MVLVQKEDDKTFFGHFIPILCLSNKCFLCGTRSGCNIPPTSYKAKLGKQSEVFSLHDLRYQGDHKAYLVRDLLVMGEQGHFPSHGI
jgi:cAMP phosphodiesterase